MSTETCINCKEDSTPWEHLRGYGHICHECSIGKRHEIFLSHEHKCWECFGTLTGDGDEDRKSLLYCACEICEAEMGSK